MNNEEIKEIVFLLHNDRLTESGKRKLENYITNLQEENKKLKELCDKYEEEHKTAFQTWQKNNIEAFKKTNSNIEILFKDNCVLQQRIDKAIEYIEKYEMGKYDYSIPAGGIIELKDILKGDENTVKIIEEEKKIEKISNAYYHDTQDMINQTFQRKINELIDEINKLKEDKQ